MGQSFTKGEVARLMGDGGSYSLQEVSGAWMISVPKEYARDEIGLSPGDNLTVIPSDDDDVLFEVVSPDY